MMLDPARPRVRAVLVLEMRDGERALGDVVQGSSCDLALVDRLLKLQLVASRFGMRLRVREPDDQFRTFVEALGFSEVLGVMPGPAEDHSSRRGGNPNSGNRSG